MKAIAHFEFEGRCLHCPCANWDYDECQLIHAEIADYYSEGRPDFCPLCIEEE
jgi:hypothetical protein